MKVILEVSRYNYAMASKESWRPTKFKSVPSVATTCVEYPQLHKAIAQTFNTRKPKPCRGNIVELHHSGVESGDVKVQIHTYLAQPVKKVCTSEHLEHING